MELGGRAELVVLPLDDEGAGRHRRERLFRKAHAAQRETEERVGRGRPALREPAQDHEGAEAEAGEEQRCSWGDRARVGDGGFDVGDLLAPAAELAAAALGAAEVEAERVQTPVGAGPRDGCDERVAHGAPVGREGMGDDVDPARLPVGDAERRPEPAGDTPRLLTHRWNRIGAALVYASMVRRSAALALALLLGACGPAAAPASQSSPTPTQTPLPSAPGASATASATAPAATTRPPQSAQCGQILLADFTLANDLTCDKDALIAGADNITIDLGGRTLKGPGMGPQTWPAPQLDSVGVRVEGRIGVTVKNGNTSDFSTGLYIHHTSGSTVRKNHVAVNIYGLHLQNADDNLIQGNQLVRQTYNSPGGYGIYLFASQRNKIIENDIENNVNWGIWFSEARNNLTYHNNVAGNRPQVSDNTEGNTWHDAATKRGNYWGDYRGRDTNADGIGDSGAYLILGPADVVDPYPFVERDGWKKASRTIDTYSPPVARAPKEVQVLALTSDGSVVSARPSGSAVTDTGVRGTSIALQSDGHTVYALDGQRLQVWDAASGSSRVQQVAIQGGIVAANRDGVSALVVSRTGAQQIDTTSGHSEFFAYAKQPGGIAPSYKHNHIFVGTERGLDQIGRASCRERV